MVHLRNMKWLLFVSVVMLTSCATVGHEFRETLKVDAEVETTKNVTKCKCYFLRGRRFVDGHILIVKTSGDGMTFAECATFCAEAL